MKKVIFAVLAAFMVSLSFTSCSKSPEGKVIGLMEDVVSALKDTHIKSQDDVTKLAEKLKTIKEDSEKAMKELAEAYKDKSQDELKEIQKEYAEKVEKIEKEAEAEGERLQKEAAEANVDLSPLAEFDLF